MDGFGLKLQSNLASSRFALATQISEASRRLGRARREATTEDLNKLKYFIETAYLHEHKTEKWIRTRILEEYGLLSGYEFES